MAHSHRRRGVTAALCSVALAALALPALAGASTVTMNGTRVIYTAAPGVANDLMLEEGNDNELRIYSADDPVQTVPAGCYDNDGNAAAPHGGVTCNGTEVAEVKTGDLSDVIDATTIFSSIRTEIDPGSESDVVRGSGAADTISSVDGFADRIGCGGGTDTANVDQYDFVEPDCETRNVTQLDRRATEDRPPTVAWTEPASDAVTMSNVANTLRADASDDVAVARVEFLAGNRLICTDTAAPYECSYSPTDADVGKATLVAVVYDSAGQTATALRFVSVDRFKPTRLSSKVSPGRDRTFPYRFKASGKLSLPEGVSAEEGCRGKVRVRYKVGRKTISSRKAKVRSNCRWSRKVAFGQRYRLTRGKLRVFATFQGNDVLKRRSASRRTVRVGG